jgi:hypothetical protein
VGGGRVRQLELPGPLVGQHQRLIVGVALGVALLVALLASAALVWVLMDSRSQRHLRA